MAYPSLPIEPRAKIAGNIKMEPYVSNLKKGQVTAYRRRNYRNVPNKTVSYSIYVENAIELENFLIERAGYKPFLLPQDNFNYVCLEYSITYTDFDKGNIQLTLTRYTNRI